LDGFWSSFVFIAAMSCGSARSFLQRVFRRDLAVHIPQQIGELLARLQQFSRRWDLAGNGGRRTLSSRT
jgi:hypothetical protein